jgi:parallel beta-helix repeat protein
MSTSPADMAPTGGGESRVDFFVSPAGDDRWSGTLPEPNASATDGPFATLARARDAVREFKRTTTGSPAPITVMVRGGKYYLPETLVLAAKDGGNRDCLITWTAYPGEKPILSGGLRIGGWRPFKGAILQARLPVRAERWRFRQLFFNGERKPRARWPKSKPANPLYGGWAVHEGCDETNPFQAFRYPKGFLRRRWAKPAMAEVVIFGANGWFNEIIPVASVDRRRRVITLQRPVKDFDRRPWYLPLTLGGPNRFCVENALEELDQPGEWCLDSERGVLYFWPPDGTDPGEVVVPRLDCLVSLRGASWVTITGLTFIETTDGDNYHRDGGEGVGAMFNTVGLRYCGDAVHLRGAEHCRIEGNLFRSVGGNAIYLEGHNARNVIARNEIAYAGANGICLVGAQGSAPIFNYVEDNHIHHCGVYNRYTAGVFCGVSDGNIIGHNRIEHMPHHGVNLSENAGGRNVVEYNEIRHTCQEIADNAAINCWMELPPAGAERCGHVIRYNLIADTYGCEVINGEIGPARAFPTSGIYLDNYASNCVVYGNIIMRAFAAGVLVHGGKNNVIENNIFVDCGANVRLQDVVCTLPYWHAMAGFMTGNHIARNIGYQTRADRFLFHLDAWTDRVVARCDENLFFQAGGEYRMEHTCSLVNRVRKPTGELDEQDRVETLTAWQRLGYDAHSVFADPRFVDPQRDDFRLRPASPALRLGFHAIPVDEIGIRGKAGA